MTASVKLVPVTGPGAWKSPSKRTDLHGLSVILLGCFLTCTGKEGPEEGFSPLWVLTEQVMQSQ